MTPIRTSGPWAEFPASVTAVRAIAIGVTLSSLSTAIAYFYGSHPELLSLLGVQIAWLLSSVCLLALAVAGLVLYTPERRLGRMRHVVTVLSLGVLACAVFQAPSEATLLHLL